MSIYVDRGIAYCYLEQYTEALGDLNKAIDAGADLAAAYNARGCVHSRLKEYEQALNDFNKSTEIDPNFQKPYANRAILLTRASDG